MIALTEELLETAKENDGSGEASPNLQLSGSSFDVSLSPTLLLFELIVMLDPYKTLYSWKKVLHL